MSREAAGAAWRAALQGPAGRVRERAAEALGRLQPRERRLVLAAAAALAAIVVWLGVIDPIAQGLHRLDSSLVATRRDAATIGDLTARYRRLRAEVSELDRKLASDDSAPSVFALLESIAVPIAGRERITAMNPQSRSLDDELTEESVEMRLEGISLRALLSLLHAIEQRDRPLQVVRVSLRRQYKHPELLDATLVVARLHARP